MSEESKNQAAVELGKLGGKKTAERGPEYYAEINAQRKVKAGGRPKNPPEATHLGEIRIGEAQALGCAVLADGRRVLSERGVGRALGKGFGGNDFKQVDGAARVPFFVSPKNIQPFISKDLMVLLTQPIVYRDPRAGLRPAYGVEATLLPKVCDVWLRARDAGALSTSQLPIAAKADILMRGLAHTGIIALVDEATGYQQIRDRQALQAILDAYLRKEFAAWAKRFPDEFYQQMFRLRGWQWKGMKVNRPQVVGHYTNDLVWDRIAPGLRKELEARNPKNDRGRRKSANHQWLTEEVGDPALAQHLYALIGLQRVCPDGGWKQFYSMVQVAFPKRGDNLSMPFEDGEPVQ
jgi:hypothetical protein